MTREQFDMLSPYLDRLELMRRSHVLLLSADEVKDIARITGQSCNFRCNNDRYALCVRVLRQIDEYKKNNNL